MVISSVPFSGSWPKHGIVWNGSAFALPTLARRTNEKESSLWRTPTASECAGRSSLAPPNSAVRLSQQVATHGKIVRRALARPTPTARDWKSGTGATIREGHSPPLTDVLQGNLNPSWVEALMGFPIGWTDIDGQPDLMKSNMDGSQSE
jgi:hypothetical protein